MLYIGRHSTIYCLIYHIVWDTHAKRWLFLVIHGHRIMATENNPLTTIVAHRFRFIIISRQADKVSRQCVIKSLKFTIAAAFGMAHLGSTIMIAN